MKSKMTVAQRSIGEGSDRVDAFGDQFLSVEIHIVHLIWSQEVIKKSEISIKKNYTKIKKIKKNKEKVRKNSRYNELTKKNLEKNFFQKIFFSDFRKSQILSRIINKYP